MWKNPVNSQSESIRIRLPYQLEQRLIAEKNRTGKSVSQITVFSEKVGKRRCLKNF